MFEEIEHDISVAQMAIAADRRREIAWIRAWHKKIVEDAKTGLVDFHEREQQAHAYIKKLLSYVVE